MEYQSGFFGQWEDGVPTLVAPELLHISGSGLTMLYRSRTDGRNRLYKVLSPQFRGDPLYESLLRKEFEIGYSLTHPGICAYYSFTTLSDLGNAIEMEWIEGRTLREILSERSPLPGKDALTILDELLDAISYMHSKQVVHRDLKPENIMVTNSGKHIKIIDFGFSDSDFHFTSNGPAGTAAYAAPELLIGEKTDQRADIWSLGAIMKELVPRYRSIWRRCMVADPADRYQDAEQINAAIKKRTRAKVWITVVVFLIAILITALMLKTYGPSDVDSLVREAEEAISLKISTLS